MQRPQCNQSNTRYTIQFLVLCPASCYNMAPFNKKGTRRSHVPTLSEIEPLKVVNLDDPRHCPHCGSNKWKWLETIPASPKTIGLSLLMRYECEKCANEFLAAEKAQATLIDTVPDRCVHCGSPRIEMVSKPNADIDLYFCKQCRCWMGMN